MCLCSFRVLSNKRLQFRRSDDRAQKPAKRVRLGDALAALGRKVGLTDEDIAAIDQARDKSPAGPMKFE